MWINSIESYRMICGSLRAVIIFLLLITSIEPVSNQPLQNITGKALSSDEIELNWLTGEGSEVISEYHLSCSGASGNVSTSTSTAQNGVVSGLIENATYMCWVSACTESRCGNSSESISVNTLSKVPLATPYNVSVRNISSMWAFVECSDLPPDKWGGDDGRQLCLLVEKNEVSFADICIDYPYTSWNVTGLVAYVKYNISVYAKNAYGEGPKSKYRITMETDELAPVNTPRKVVFSNIEVNRVIASWEPIIDLPGKLRGYTVLGEIKSSTAVRRKRRSASDPFYNGTLKTTLQTVITSSNALNLTVNDLFGNSVYSLTIAANTKYKGSNNQSFTVKTMTGTPVVSVINKRCCENSYNSVTLCWDHAPDLYLQGTRSRYIIYYRKDNSTISRSLTRAHSRTSALVYPLLTHAAYTFSISAWTADGEGIPSEEIICTTAEGKPAGTPENVSATSYEFPQATTVTWSAIFNSSWLGTPGGYVIAYKRLRYGSNFVTESWKFFRTASLATNHHLVDLNVYSLYALKIAAYTSAGDGGYGKSVKFETCRYFHPEVAINYIYIDPFVVPSKESSPEGLMLGTTERAISHCSGRCTSFKNVVHFIYKKADVTTEQHLLSLTRKSNDSEVYLPYRNPNVILHNGAFVNTLQSPGFVLISANESPEELITRNEQSITRNIMTSIQLFLLYVIVSCLFGTVFFFLEPMNVEERTSFYTLCGMFEAVYMAVLTSTTVGYGDKVPKTFHGKTIFLCWIFLGLSLLCICVGNVNSSLLLVRINKHQSVYPRDEISVRTNSTERKWAATRMNISNAKYNSYEDLFDALQSGRTRYALIDQFSLEAFNSKLSSTGVNIAKTYPSVESEFGALLTGEMRLLKTCMEGFIQDNPHLTDENIVKMKKRHQNRFRLMPETFLPLINVHAPIYQQIVMIFGIMIMSGLFIGIAWEFFRRGQAKKSRYRIKTSLDVLLARQKKLKEFCDQIMEEMELLAKGFHKNTEGILFKQGEELLSLNRSLSKLYGVNFKYIKIGDLSLSLKKISEYKEELKRMPKLSWTDRLRSAIIRHKTWRVIR